MKRLIIIIPVTLLIIGCMLQACKKEDKYPSRVVTISYPVVTLLGPADTTINRNATWTDPGATWVDSVTNEHGSLTLSVNTSTDSAYILTYTATNKNGFQTNVYRGLAVTNMNNTINISGWYNDSYGARDSIYKVSRALFYTPSADCQGNPGLIAIKSDSTISVATIVTADLTGALIPETFSQDTILYQAPITFWYTPSLPNVPPGSYSSVGLPMGLTVTFSQQSFSSPVQHGGVVIQGH